MIEQGFKSVIAIFELIPHLDKETILNIQAIQFLEFKKQKKIKWQRT